MIGLVPFSYKSTHGTVTLVTEKERSYSYKLLKIEIGDAQYEKDSLIKLYSLTSGDSDKKLTEPQLIYIKDINKLLVLVDGFAFMYLEHDSEELSYLIKAHSEKDISREFIKEMLDTNRITRLGTLEYKDKDKKVTLISYNNTLYGIKQAIKFDKNVIIAVTDNIKNFFISENNQYIINLNVDLFSTDLLDTYATHANRLRSDLYSISGTLIDNRYNKLFDISRGYWEAYNPCPYNRITEEYKDKYSDRYFVAESTEYCGVLIDFYTALYDYVDEKIYWVQGDNCFRDRDKKRISW